MTANLLLDTHVFLWAAAAPDRLRIEVREAIEDRDHDVFVSAATIWEISIKRRLGKVKAPRAIVAKIDKMGFQHLPITLEQAHNAGSLPLHHKDPFDRMLVAQSIGDRLVLVTHDATLGRYGGDVMLV